MKADKLFHTYGWLTVTP